MGTTRTTEKRTDDETVPAQAAAAEEETSPAADGKAGADGSDKHGDLDAAGTEASGDVQDQDESQDESQDEDEDTAPAARAASGVAAGAGAVVAAGLGLASVTGTWLGTLMAERQTLVGQIKLQSGQASDQIAAIYGTPWHTTAMVNGVFALLAVVVGAVVLTRPGATWVRAVAWGALALGVLGILISAGMYLDMFGSLPSIPKGARPGA